MVVLHVAREPCNGVWRSMCLLAAELRRNDINAYLGLFVGSRWKHANELNSVGIPHFISSTPSVNATTAHLYHLLLSNKVPTWCRLLQAKHRNEKMVVHYHSGALTAAFLVGSALAGSIGQIITFHGPPLPNTLGRQPVRRFINRRFAARLRSRGVALVSVDEPALSVFEETLGLSSSLFHVIPNGADDALLNGPNFGSPAAPFRIGYIGSLYEQKGWSIAADAAELLHIHGHDVRISIAGSGPHERRAKEWCDGRREFAEFLGYVPNAAEHVMPSLHCLCLPSVSEGLPNVVLEAMACGVVVVSTAVGGVPRIIQHDSNGLLVERTTHRVAEAIERLIGDPGLRDRLRLRAASTIREQYTTRTMAKHYLQQYDMAVCSGKSRYVEAIRDR